LAFGLLVASVVLPARASAHGEPPELAFFGPFLPRTFDCLRVISRAAQRCFRRAFAAERTCAAARDAGDACDAAARDAEITAAVRAASQAVGAACGPGQLTELRFTGLVDVVSDLTVACTRQADTAVEFLYPPALVGSGGAPARACRELAADLGRVELNVALQAKSRALDRIGAVFRPIGEKRALLNAADARSDGAGRHLAGQLVAACPDFAPAYGFDAELLFYGLGRRADCVVGAAYVQNGLRCPLAVCGDGLRESPEQCDDGNDVDNDACRNNCTANRSAGAE
jgi:cysteine-rich repeat protein